MRHSRVELDGEVTGESVVFACIVVSILFIVHRKHALLHAHLSQVEAAVPGCNPVFKEPKSTQSSNTDRAP